MSTDAKVILRKLSDGSIAHSVLISEGASDLESAPDGNPPMEVEIDCKGQVAAETLIGVLVVTGSDVEIKPTESINEFSPLHAEQEGDGVKCPKCKTIMERLEQSNEPEGIRKDAHCPNCGNTYAVHKGCFRKLDPAEPGGNGKKPAPA